MYVSSISKLLVIVAKNLSPPYVNISPLLVFEIVWMYGYIVLSNRRLTLVCGKYYVLGICI